MNRAYVTAYDLKLLLYHFCYLSDKMEFLLLFGYNTAHANIKVDTVSSISEQNTMSPKNTAK